MERILNTGISASEVLFPLNVTLYTCVTHPLPLYHQFSTVRGICLQGKSRQVPVCSLYGHLPLTDQNRRPAVWRPTGPQNVWGYRLGKSFCLFKSIMVVRGENETHNHHVGSFICGEPMCDTNGQKKSRKFLLCPVFCTILWMKSLSVVYRHVFSLFVVNLRLSRSWKKPLRRKHLSITASCQLWFGPQNSCCPRSQQHHKSRTWYVVHQDSSPQYDIWTEIYSELSNNW